MVFMNFLSFARANHAGFVGGLLLGGLVLSGCSQTLPGLGEPFSPPQSREAPLAVPSSPSQDAGRLALILPLSASGNAGVAANSLKNAADMAQQDFADAGLKIVVKDDAGQPETARIRTEEALQEGAELVLGPLFAPAVQAASQVARAKNVPVIAFSTDTNVAGSGTYLLSFLPEWDVESVVAHAIKDGKRRFAVLAPESAYGNVVMQVFQQAVTSRGGTVVATGRYPLDSLGMEQPIRQFASQLGQADALLLPEGGDALPTVLDYLSLGGAPLSKIQLLGTGLWNDARVWRLRTLQNAKFVAPDAEGYNDFARRYKARFNTDPTRVASLAYDAVALAAALKQTRGAQRYQASSLTDPQGFAGVDGLFRFRANGFSERGLAVLQINNGTARTVVPAARSF